MPKYFQILKVSSIKEAVDLCLFSYKEYFKIGKKSVAHIDIWNDPKYCQHKAIFLSLAKNLCKIIYDADPDIRLESYQFIKVCIDHFEALQEDYKNRNLRGFKVYQIHTPYAMDVFTDFYSDNFKSIENYLENLFPGKNRKQFKETPKTAVEKSSFTVKKSEKISGLSEVTFN